ncbi:TPA: hypothetical protein H2R31_004979 [Salmonella enterica]|nr:hypothetical protein [Salmonella enterica]
MTLKAVWQRLAWLGLAWLGLAWLGLAEKTKTALVSSTFFLLKIIVMRKKLTFADDAIQHLYTTALSIPFIVAVARQ